MRRDYDAKALAEAIIRKRGELRLTQAQAAEQIGTSKVTLNRIETLHGTPVPNAMTLYRIRAWLER